MTKEPKPLEPHITADPPGEPIGRALLDLYLVVGHLRRRRATSCLKAEHLVTIANVERILALPSPPASVSAADFESAIVRARRETA